MSSPAKKQKTHSSLTFGDLQKLEQSYIPQDLVAQARIFRVDTFAGARAVGRKPEFGKDYTGLVFPYIDPGQTQPYEYRLRRDNPDFEVKPDGTRKEQAKYLSPSGIRSANLIYYVPGTLATDLQTTSIPIVITEGEKKTLSLYRFFSDIQQRVLAMGFPGVWNWRGTIGKAPTADGGTEDVKGPIPRLDKVNWQGRIVQIAFDSNTDTNAGVFAARDALAAELTKRGAIVYFVDLPQIDGVNGVDDLLAAKGAGFVRDVFDQARPFQPVEVARTLHRELDKLASPDLTCIQAELQIDLPETGLVFIKSPMGTGKTKLITRLVEENTHHGRKTIVLGSRNSLLRQTCTRAGLTHIHDIKVDGNPELTAGLIESSQHIALCVDSVQKIPVPSGPYDIIMDEIESIVDHTLSGETCKDNRAGILAHFTKLVTQATRVIGMDAGLTDVTRRYIENICPNTPTFTVVNSLPAPAWDVSLYTGTVDRKGVHPMDRSGFYADFFAALASGERVLLASDSQKDLEALEKEIRQRFPDKHGLRVDRKTTSSDHPDFSDVEKFLNEPNGWTETAQPDFVLYSPTVESGVSLTVPHFTQVWGVFFGVVTHQTILQMLGRYRVPVPRRVWVATRGMITGKLQSPLPHDTHKQLFSYHTETVKAVAFHRNPATEMDDTALMRAIADLRAGDRWNDPHLDTLCTLIARRNFSLLNLRDNVLEALAEAGHNLTTITPTKTEITKEAKEAVKARKNEVEIERATAIAETRTLDQAEVQQIQGSQTRTNQQQTELDRYFLGKTIPGVDLTPELVHTVLFACKGILQALKLLWLAANPETAETLDAEAYQQSKLDQNTPLVLNDLLPDLVGLQARTLDQLGILQLCRDGEQFTVLDPQVIEIATKAKAPAMQKQIQQAFNLDVTPKSYPVHIIGRLLRRVGFRLESKQTRNGDQRDRVYTVRSILPEEQHTLVFKAIGNRYASSQAQNLSQNSHVYNDKESSVTNIDPAAMLESYFTPNPFAEYETILGLPETWVKCLAFRWIEPDYQWGADDVQTLQDMASRTNHPKAQTAVNDIATYLEQLKQWATSEERTVTYAGSID
jgi:uncharacterized protein (DUF2249 family)